MLGAVPSVRTSDVSIRPGRTTIGEAAERLRAMKPLGSSARGPRPHFAAVTDELRQSIDEHALDAAELARRLTAAIGRRPLPPVPSVSTTTMIGREGRATRLAARSSPPAQADTRKYGQLGRLGLSDRGQLRGPGQALALRPSRSLRPYGRTMLPSSRAIADLNARTAVNRGPTLLSAGLRPSQSALAGELSAQLRARAVASAQLGLASQSRQAASAAAHYARPRVRVRRRTSPDRRSREVEAFIRYWSGRPIRFLLFAFGLRDVEQLASAGRHKAEDVALDAVSAAIRDPRLMDSLRQAVTLAPYLKEPQRELLLHGLTSAEDGAWVVATSLLLTGIEGALHSTAEAHGHLSTRMGDRRLTAERLARIVISDPAYRSFLCRLVYGDRGNPYRHGRPAHPARAQCALAVVALAAWLDEHLTLGAMSALAGMAGLRMRSSLRPHIPR